MKTWKKIEETKRRANDVVKARLANEERQRRKMQAIEDERIRQEERKAQMAAIRAAKQEESKKIKGAVGLHKKEEAKQAKFVDQQNKQRM